MSSRSEVVMSIGRVARKDIRALPSISSYYGVNSSSYYGVGNLITFNDVVMQRKTSDEAFEAFKRWQESEEVVNPALADEIAAAMKDWAVENGAVTGEALYKNLPLQHSGAAVSKAAADLLKLLGRDAKQVYSTCGVEQEYFLIDNDWYKLRPDLVLTGRTLTGIPPTGQQTEGQYFGSIRERALNFIHDVCRESSRLGILVTARRNDTALSPYGFAAISERTNLAVGHNLLLMDVMKRTAPRYNLACLFHEKPFDGVDGSGKRVSWSLFDDSGKNLLSPGDTPEENLIFLTTLVSVIHAIYKHNSLLCAAAASAGNESRLGAGESPSAIMSVHLGEQLTKIIAAIENGKAEKGKKQDVIDLLAKFTHDTADRSHTSPVAFTGAAFEFRALGSSMDISAALTVINTIAADSMAVIGEKIRKELKNAPDAGDGGLAAAVLKVLGGILKEVKPILFDGDNYSDEWVKEAEKRGLRSAASAPEAFKAFIAPEAVELFDRHKVYSKAEMISEYNIRLGQYEKALETEARALIETVKTQILPSAYTFQSDISSGLEVLRDLSDDMTIDMAEGALEDRKEVFENLTADIFYIRKNVKELDALLNKARGIADLEEKAAFFFSDIKPQMDHIRRHVDALETTMPDELWPLPKYREMLFIF